MNDATDVISDVTGSANINLAGRQKDLYANVDEQAAFDFSRTRAGNDVALFDFRNDIDPVDDVVGFSFADRDETLGIITRRTRFVFEVFDQDLNRLDRLRVGSTCSSHSLREMVASDLKPISTTTASSSTRTILPSTIFVYGKIFIFCIGIWREKFGQRFIGREITVHQRCDFVVFQGTDKVAIYHLSILFVRYSQTVKNCGLEILGCVPDLVGHDRVRIVQRARPRCGGCRQLTRTSQLYQIAPGWATH